MRIYKTFIKDCQAKWVVPSYTNLRHSLDDPPLSARLQSVAIFAEISGVEKL